MNKAFTLIELLVVVLIIGILSAIALPQYTKAVKRARCVEAIINLKAITDAQERYALANGFYTNNLEDLDITPPVSNYFSFVCREQRTCDAQPRKSGYPEFQFHMQQKISALAQNKYLGKHWCEAISDDETKKNICKTFGTEDETMQPSTVTYYLMN